MKINFIKRTQISQFKNKGFKFIGFGAGYFGLKTINFLDNPFEYFIDNSQSKIKSGWKEYTEQDVNVEIKHFDKLSEENNEKVVVIICSEHFEAMHKQLHKAYPSVQVYKSPLLKDLTVFSKLDNCSETILVSAYGGSGGLYLVDGRTRKYEILKQGSFRGITKYQNNILVADEFGAIYKISSFKNKSIEQIFRPSQRTNTHGILYWEEKDLLFVTETLNDCISVYEPSSFEKIDEIHISHKSQKKGGNFHHINDLELFNDKIYISAISKSGNFYNDFLDGVIYELDYCNTNNLTPVLDKLLFQHAVRKFKNTLIFLNSFNGDILNIANEKLINLPGFIRGMDSDENLLYVGQSRHRRLEKSLKYFNGVSTESGIYVVDLQSRMFKFILMPDMCDIFGIKILNTNDVSK